MLTDPATTSWGAALSLSPWPVNGSRRRALIVILPIMMTLMLTLFGLGNRLGSLWTPDTCPTPPSSPGTAGLTSVAPGTADSSCSLKRLKMWSGESVLMISWHLCCLQDACLSCQWGSLNKCFTFILGHWKTSLQKMEFLSSNFFYKLLLKWKYYNIFFQKWTKRSFRERNCALRLKYKSFNKQTKNIYVIVCCVQ